MTSSARPLTPVNGAHPAPQPAPKAAAVNYIDEVAARLDQVHADATSPNGEVVDAVSAQLATLSGTTPTEKVTFALPNFEVLNVAPARDLLDPAPAPRALLTSTPAEVDAAITALEAELHRDPADTPTAEIPALADQPVITRAQLHGSRRHNSLITKALLLVAGLVIAWIAVGAAAVLAGTAAAAGYIVLTLTAIAVAVGRPRHEGRHARGYVARHSR